MKKTKEVKIAMMSAASLALDYLKQYKNADTEQAVRHVMKNFKVSGDEKLAGIAAANFVLKYKERNSKATPKQVLQELADNTENLLNSIRNQDESQEMSSL